MYATNKNSPSDPGMITAEEIPAGSIYFSSGPDAYAIAQRGKCFRVMEVGGGISDGRMIGYTVAAGTTGGGIVWFDAGELDPGAREVILRVLAEQQVFVSRSEEVTRDYLDLPPEFVAGLQRAYDRLDVGDPGIPSEHVDAEMMSWIEELAGKKPA